MNHCGRPEKEKTCTCASFFTVRGIHKKDCPQHENPVQEKKTCRFHPNGCIDDGVHAAPDVKEWERARKEGADILRSRISEAIGKLYVDPDGFIDLDAVLKVLHEV